MFRMCNEQLNLQSEGRSLSLPCMPHIRKAIALGIRTVAFLLWYVSGWCLPSHTVRMHPWGYLPGIQIVAFPLRSDPPFSPGREETP